MTKKLTETQVEALEIALQAENDSKPESGIHYGVHTSNRNTLIRSYDRVPIYDIYTGTAKALEKLGFLRQDERYSFCYYITDAGRQALTEAHTNEQQPTPSTRPTSTTQSE